MQEDEIPWSSFVLNHPDHLKQPHIELHQRKENVSDFSCCPSLQGCTAERIAELQKLNVRKPSGRGSEYSTWEFSFKAGACG